MPQKNTTNSRTVASNRKERTDGRNKSTGRFQTGSSRSLRTGSGKETEKSGKGGSFLYRDDPSPCGAVFCGSQYRKSEGQLFRIVKRTFCGIQRERGNDL